VIKYDRVNLHTESKANSNQFMSTCSHENKLIVDKLRNRVADKYRKNIFQ